ncbi:MAG: TatD family hydrolase [Lachnoclostridium sp.]|nr:TatD family hydrolase [Lachnoclostridium sp.]
MIKDFHTHTPRPEAIVNYDPAVDLHPFAPGLLYSAGIHPWNAALADNESFVRLRELAFMPEVVAIGETGLDAAVDVDEAIQEELFKKHIELARLTGKPLIIHCVRRYNELMAIRRDSGADVPWIIHGFRGKPQLAQSLARQGFYISFGERFNPASFDTVPASQRLIETDESQLSIEEIARAAGYPDLTAPPLQL